VFGGRGLAHVPRGIGQASEPVLVAFAAPGERVRIRIGPSERGVRRATIEEVLDPSPSRRGPACAHFGICGGCQLQHLRYEAQLAAKVGFVRDALRRIARIDWSGEIPVETGPEYGWRARAELHVEGGRIGYRRAGSRDHVPVGDCPILVDPLRDELRRLASGETAIPRGASRVRLVALEDGRIARAWDRGGERSPEAASFSQANPFLAEVLVRRAIGEARGRTAIDLYAGSGFFTLPLAQRFATVHAVESDAAAVRLGRERAHSRAVGNIAWCSATVAAWLDERRGPARPDFVLLDPPRGGAGPEVVPGIAALEAPRIAYVACDPATLARDLGTFAAAGYALASLAIVDLFPQSYHVETVAELAHL
jgi:23S rRNA (uracil1939-C5)-methyltransferase